MFHLPIELLYLIQILNSQLKHLSSPAPYFIAKKVLPGFHSSDLFMPNECRALSDSKGIGNMVVCTLICSIPSFGTSSIFRPCVR